MSCSPLSDEAIARHWGDTPRFTPEQIRHQGEAIFRAFGLCADDAAIAMTTLLAADWRGIESHGVARIPYYAIGFLQQGITPGAPLTTQRETPVSLALHGNNGTGLVQGPRAMEHCIEKAKQSGLCMTTVKGSNHYGIAGHYALMAVEAGLIAMSMTNSGSLTAPTFGAKAMLGSNPIAFAVPMGPGKDPFVLDMATSTVAYGKIEIAQRARKPIPAGWAIDHDGYATTDPFQMGAIMPLGGDKDTCGHKGYGLGMMVDILCGPMGGGSTSWKITDGIRSENPAGTSHFFAAWQIEAFRDPEELYADLEAMFADLRATPVAPGAPSDRVLIPGEPEAAEHAYNLRHGIPIRREVLVELRDVCRDVDVPFELAADGLDTIVRIATKSDH